MISRGNNTYYDVKEAARMARVHEQTFRNYVQKLNIQPKRTTEAKKYYFSFEDIQAVHDAFHNTYNVQTII